VDSSKSSSDEEALSAVVIGGRTSGAFIGSMKMEASTQKDNTARMTTKPIESGT